jgi:phosphate transport system permease protein
LPSIRKFGWGFAFTSTWDPVAEIFGALPVIYGTLLSSLIALLIATPLGVGAALFLTEVAPILISPRISKALSFLIEILAAIPSVVYGLWGLFVLAPLLKGWMEPLLADYLGFFGPFFSGPKYGVGMLAAGFILAIMIIPTLFSISKEIFLAVPSSLKEAALALGATRWEMMKISVLNAGKRGILGAVILGLSRALGETMAVTMVIGNSAKISASLFAPGQTMASVIANEYAEATGELHLAALAEIGLVLFFITFIVNALARIMILKGFPTEDQNNVIPSLE